jgi:hypothetical protein
VDAVSTLSNVEYSRDVHCGNFPMGANKFGHGLTLELSRPAKRARLERIVRLHCLDS